MNVEELPASVVRRLPEPSVVPAWAMVTPFAVTLELLVTASFVNEAASLPWMP